MGCLTWRLLRVTLALVLALAVLPPPVATAAVTTRSPGSDGMGVAQTDDVGALLGVRGTAVRLAMAQRGKPYRFGAAGLWAFDCSGLVRYVYWRAGVSAAIGGGHNARAMYLWGRARGLTSRTRPLLGDLVVFGNGAHIGIYVGNGRVVSALNPWRGVVLTPVSAIRPLFTTYIHTRLGN